MNALLDLFSTKSLSQATLWLMLISRDVHRVGCLWRTAGAAFPSSSNHTRAAAGHEAGNLARDSVHDSEWAGRRRRMDSVEARLDSRSPRCWLASAGRCHRAAAGDGFR